MKRLRVEIEGFNRYGMSIVPFPSGLERPTSSPWGTISGLFDVAAQTTLNRPDCLAGTSKYFSIAPFQTSRKPKFNKKSVEHCGCRIGRGTIVG